MYIWRGWGWVLPAIVFSVMYANEAIIHAIGGEGLWRDYLPFFGGLGALAGSAVVFFLRLIWLPKHRARTDPNTGLSVTITERHEWFGMDIIWWSILLMVGAAIVMAVPALVSD